MRYGNKVIKNNTTIFQTFSRARLNCKLWVFSLSSWSVWLRFLFWFVQFTDNTLSQVSTRVDTAALSTQIRSESLVLTDMVRRYTAHPVEEPGPA